MKNAARQCGVKSHLEELVNDVDSHVERLLQQLELGVDLNQPVYQHSPHLTIDRTPGGQNAKISRNDRKFIQNPNSPLEKIFSDGETVFHPSEVAVDGRGVLHAQLGIELVRFTVNVSYFCRDLAGFLFLLFHFLHLRGCLHLHVIINHRDARGGRERFRDSECFLQSQSSTTWSDHIAASDHF